MSHEKVNTFLDWLKTFSPILWEKHIGKPFIRRPRYNKPPEELSALPKWAEPKSKVIEEIPA